MTQPLIDGQRVLHIMRETLAANAASPAITVEGLVRTFAFDPTKLEPFKTEIGEMLSNLPDNFQAKKGGGWTFLNACNDRNGRQWTGLHSTMEELFCLGIATGQAEWIMKDMTDILPGGVPYVNVNPELEPVA